jgi:hypothetical protein
MQAAMASRLRKPARKPAIVVAAEVVSAFKSATAIASKMPLCST